MKYCDACRATYPTEFLTCPKDQAPLRDATELVDGMILRGKYEILAKVGSGGMASVYKARHIPFGEIRAIKLVGRHFADDPEFLQRFRTEAVVTRRLQHPNAVRVDDLDATEDGRPFIIMEFVEGVSLRTLLQEKGALPLNRALGIACQVAEALGAAHRLGIIHRDIKPENILLTSGADGADVVKVVDFGIAKVCEGGVDVGPGYATTQTGIVVGTPQYLSPEQASGKRGDELDGRADLYALGLVLYEMLTGQLPFQGRTSVEILLHHVQTTPVPPHVARPDLGIPVEVSSLLMRALAKDRRQRFQTGQEMAQALLAQASRLGPGVSADETALLDTLPRLLPSGTGPAPRASRSISKAEEPTRTVFAQPTSGTRRTGFPWAIGVGAIVFLALVVLSVWAKRPRAQPTPAETDAGTLAETAPTQAPSPWPESRRRTKAPSETIAPPPAHDPRPPSGPSPAAPLSPGDQPRVRELLLAAKEAMDRGDYEAGVAALQEALSLEPESTVAHGALRKATAGRLVFEGRRALERADADRAIKAFRAALDLDPTNLAARLGLRRAQQQKAGRGRVRGESPP